MCVTCMYHVSCVSVALDMRHHVCLLHEICDIMCVCYIYVSYTYIMCVCYMRYEASHDIYTCMYHVFISCVSVT